MATTKSDSPDKKQIIDVAKPGKSAPDASTRPLIVGHKPLMKDPMVNAGTEDTDESTEPEAVSPSRGMKIVTPPTKEAPTAESSPAPAPETPKTDNATLMEKPVVPDNPPADATPDEDDPSPAEIAMQKHAVPKSESSDGESKSSDGAAVDAMADEAVRKKEEESLAEHEIERLEAVHKLIETKKYYIPVGQANHTRNTALLTILILLALVVAGAAAAIDAGIVTVPFELPFNFL